MTRGSQVVRQVSAKDPSSVRFRPSRPFFMDSNNIYKFTTDNIEIFIKSHSKEEAINIFAQEYKDLDFRNIEKVPSFFWDGDVTH